MRITRLVCIMVSVNPTNRDRSRHVDVRSMYTISVMHVTSVRDGHLKLVKCAGPQNVSDALTKRLTDTTSLTKRLTDTTCF